MGKRKCVNCGELTYGASDPLGAVAAGLCQDCYHVWMVEPDEDKYCQRAAQRARGRKQQELR
jgi:NMD protein affecting ribosome stability and mRNA decay